MNKKIFVPILCAWLVVGVLSGCVEEEEPAANNAPVAAFTVDIVNMTATFTDASTDADDDTLTYSWDFGDDETSTEQNPVHEYAENDTYTVTLTVSDGTDTDDETEDIIVGNIAPTADFTFEATNLSVNFTDASTDPNGLDDIVNWTWDFDDGSMSYEQSPIYEYAEAGTYNVTLTIEDTYGLSDNITKQIEITE
jgi:PKD repeat protein